MSLYAYVNKHNTLTEVQMRLPVLTKQLQICQEENVRLQFTIEKFENPLHLMELARKPEFSYLKHPYTRDIIYLQMDKEDE
jgi:dynactin complex subunit